jgi:long-chain fatty acid transport protein
MRSSIRKSTVFVCLAAGLGGAGVAQATNGYQLIGVGAYQKSLGGAVTANPGSAMTAISNPAGMARIGRRADFSMEAFMPERHVDFTATGGEESKSSMDMYGVPAIGWTAPVGDRDDLWFGGGMYGTSGMGVDYASTFMVPAGAMGPNPDMYWDGYSNIMLWQMAPTVAWDVDERLTVGASLNINYQSVAFKQRVMGDTTADGQGDLLVQNFDLSRASSAFGFGVSLGVLFDVNDRLTVGAAYKSKQVFSDLEYNLAQGDIGELNMGTGEYEGAPAGVYRLGLDFPQQLAVGLAFRATPQVTVSADLKWINWSDTMDTLSVNGPARRVRGHGSGLG